MEKRVKAILKAREWIGTPWRHNQRIKGVGVDCINFLHEVARSVDIYLPPFPENYIKVPLKNEVEEYLKENFIKRRDKDIQIGRVLLYSFQGFKTHVAIATSDHSMIHACNLGRHHQVLEHNIDGIWIKCLDSVWEVREWASIDSLNVLGGK